MPALKSAKDKIFVDNPKTQKKNHAHSKLQAKN